MRKVLILLVVLSVAAFTGCSKDDGGSNDGIVGKWQMDKTGFIQNGQEILFPYEHECPSKKDYVELMNGGKIISVEFDDECSSDTEEGRWERNGDILKITGFESVPMEYEIVTLNSSTLKLKLSDSTVSMLIVFKRI